MNFGLDERAEAFRAEVQAFIGEHLTPEIIERAHATGTMHDWGFHRALAQRGWLSAFWPTDVGGQGRTPLEWLVFEEELYRAGAPVDGLGVAMLVARTLAIVGSDAQKRDVLPGILAGEVLPCLGYSEPDSGSDVAAAKTRAVRDGDEWVITGQKMFTTLAHEAHFVFLLARTNTDVPKHEGLTMFLVPMDAPGIEITPVETMGGERTNVTFYTDVRVSDAALVGEVDRGWSVMTTALTFERNAANLGEMATLLDRGVTAARTSGAIADPVTRERLARVAIDVEVGRLLGQQSAWTFAQGRLPTVEGSMAKLWTTEAFVRASSDLLDTLGSDGLLQHGAPGAPADGWIEHVFRHSVVTTIYGGTSEIQRGIIAERGLGLPRSRGR